MAKLWANVLDLITFAWVRRCQKCGMRGTKCICTDTDQMLNRILYSEERNNRLRARNFHHVQRRHSALDSPNSDSNSSNEWAQARPIHGARRARPLPRTKSMNEPNLQTTRRVNRLRERVASEQDLDSVSFKFKGRSGVTLKSVSSQVPPMDEEVGSVQYRRKNSPQKSYQKHMSRSVGSLRTSERMSIENNIISHKDGRPQPKCSPCRSSTATLVDDEEALKRLNGWFAASPTSTIRDSDRYLLDPSMRHVDV